MTDRESKQETILELLAEDGSLTLYGARGAGAWVAFHLELNEVALLEMLDDEELDVIGEGRESGVVRSERVPSWEDAVRLLTEKPYWHRLHPRVIHPEFEDRIFALLASQGGAAAVKRWRRSPRQS